MVDEALQVPDYIVLGSGKVASREQVILVLARIAFAVLSAQSEWSSPWDDQPVASG